MKLNFLSYVVCMLFQVLGASVYWDDKRQQYVQVGPRLVLPVNYPGKI